LEVSELEVRLVAGINSRSSRGRTEGEAQSNAVAYARQPRFACVRVVKIFPSRRALWFNDMMAVAGSVLKELPGVQSLVLVRWCDTRGLPKTEHFIKYHQVGATEWIQSLLQQVRSPLREAFFPYLIARNLRVALEACPHLTTCHVVAEHGVRAPFDDCACVPHGGVRVLTLIDHGSLEKLVYLRDVLRSFPNLKVLSLYKTDLAGLPADWRGEVVTDPTFHGRPQGWLDSIKFEAQTDGQGNWADRPVLHFHDPVTGLRLSDLNAIGVGKFA
jgi:hypothetical protein